MLVYGGKEIKSVGFVGLGRSNLGVYEYIRRRGTPEITVRCDAPTDAARVGASRVFFGKGMLSDITEDILFISPAVRRDVPELKAAEARGVMLSSDAELFFSLTESGVYAVTGSDGKSTASYLTARLLGAVLCGNIGEAMSPYLDTRGSQDCVAELSSFQLTYMRPVSERCVITNVTPNHLNWHPSFEEYASAKRNILINARERIINFDCPTVRGLAEGFELFAVFSQNEIYGELKSKAKAEIYLTEEGGAICLNGKALLPTEKIAVRGRHNILNFMAAVAASLGKCGRSDIEALAAGFHGLPHRCEAVYSARGVSYYDSSIDTSPKRCAATLRSMTERVILILGGRSKGLDFKELVPVLTEKTKLVILTGECADEIEEAIRSAERICAYVKIGDFCEAVEYAVCSAEAGDAVLLSPAAASFDSFRDFEERGRRFTEEVKKAEAKRLAGPRKNKTP